MKKSVTTNQQEKQSHPTRTKVLVDEVVLSQIRRNQVLNSIDIAINQTHQLEPLLKQIVTAVKIHLPSSGGSSIILWDEKSQSFVNSANTFEKQADEETSKRVRRESGATRWIVDNQEPLIVPDVSEDPFTANKMLKDYGLNAYVGVPLIVDERCIGVLYAQSKEQRDYSNNDVDFLKALTIRVAVAIQNVALLEEVKATNLALQEEKLALELSQQKLANSLIELEQAAQTKSHFFASMSHEIRTPLNAIIGFAELLQEKVYGPLTETQSRAVGDIFSSGTHLLDLINDLLDLSKLDAGKYVLELSDFDLYGLLHDSLNYVRQMAIQKDIALSFCGLEDEQDLVDKDGKLIVSADKLKVRQIVLNLLSNAMKYTPNSGEVILCIKEKAELYTISVKDTGIGISKDDQALLFQEFSQLDSEVNHQYKGTGLGLVLSQRLAMLHGGRITLDSTEGQGSVFSFELPKTVIPIPDTKIS